MVFHIWFKSAKAFVSEKRRIPCQIIYVTSQDKKGVVCVIVFSILQKILALVAQLDLEQSHEVKDYGKDDDLQWNMLLEAKTLGT